MKRPLLIIAIFLLAGAVVNVAVAWGCAVWVSYSTPELQFVGAHPHSFADRVVFDVFHSFGSEFVQPALDDHLGFHAGRNADHVYLEWPRFWPRFTDWSQGRTLGPIEDRWTSQIKAEEARGWPMLSLSWHYWVLRVDASSDSDSTTRSLRYGWPLGGTRVVQYNPVSTIFVNVSLREIDERILPYRPIWIGFTANTLFYASLLWLAIPGPFVLRRFLRLRRGLCPTCAYPMGESFVCTECGCELPKRARTA